MKPGNTDYRHNEGRNAGGFTMMELLVVLTIIGLLAALVGPTLYKRIAPAKQSVARAQIENFGTALDNYFIDVGHYPATADGLAALRTAPKGEKKWKGPYLKKQLPDDPWGRAYQYAAPGRNGGYEIISLGADGKVGGDGEDADVRSWEIK